MDKTAEFLKAQAELPAGSQAATELPPPVVEELRASGIGTGTFLTLLPQILAIIRLVTDGGASIGEVVRAVLDLIRNLRPAT